MHSVSGIRRCVVALVAVGLFVVSGCSSRSGNGSGSLPSGSANSSWSGVLARANAEGTVSWWSENQPPQNQRTIQAFQKAYPKIKIELVQGNTDILEPKYAQIVQSNLPGPDVFGDYNPAWVIQQQSDGAFAKPDGPDVANFPPSGVADGGYALLVNEGVNALEWNTSKLAGGLRTYADLLDPNLKGHVGIWSTAIANTMSTWQHIDQSSGPGFLNKLVSTQGPFHFYLSSAALSQAVASGEVWAGVAPAASANNVESTGAPVKWAYSAGDKPIMAPQYAVLMTKAPHPDAARVFLNFLASKAGQVATNGDGFGISALPGTPGALPYPADGVTAIDPSTWTSDYLSKYVAQWDAMFNYKR
jgi:iron(III) transport system substrate-binding protein